MPRAYPCTCSCGGDKFQDGAVTANNPSVIALQEARLLWPDHPVRARPMKTRPRSPQADLQQRLLDCLLRRRMRDAAELPSLRELLGWGSGAMSRPSCLAARAQVDVMVSLGVGQAPAVRREKGLSSFMETGSILIESRWGRPSGALFAERRGGCPGRVH